MLHFFALLPVLINVPTSSSYICFMIDGDNNVRDLTYLCGDQRKYCSNFKTQEEAQKAFDNKVPGTEHLDGDKDGKVCEWNIHK